MSFELFQDTRLRSKEYISVTDNSTFGLPRTFIDKQAITSDHKAVIFYDPQEHKVALHFTLSSPKFGFAVRIPNETQGGMIVAKSFFEKKGIDPKKYSRRYPDFEVISLQDIGFDKEGDAYVIQLVEKEEEPTAKQPVINRSTDQIVDAQIIEEPIDLDEIPF